jgi:four helix bundle protein
MPRFQGDLPERTYRFGLKILKLVDVLPQGATGWNVAKQLAKCGTSVGANTQEADNALTEREFASCCNTARREAAETTYWLRLARDHGLLCGELLDNCIAESHELTKILATIVRKTQHHLQATSA